MDRNVMVAIVSLLLVLVVTGMIAFMISGARSASRKRMMQVIKGRADHDHGKKGASAKDIRRDALSRKLKQQAGDTEKADKKRKVLQAQLVQAGLSISSRQYYVYSALLGIGLAALAFALGKPPFVVIMAAIIGLLGVPKIVVKRLIKRRQKKFTGDLADALDAMTRLLRAGMPVAEAIKMVAREFTGPVGEEMGRIFDQQKIGVSLPEAVQDCARRMPLPEVQMFATAVTIQAQTGSSLSEILEGLSKVIRARFRLRRKVQALSSEAKSSAMIIGALPIFVALAMYFINPDYIGTLFIDQTGHLLLAGAVFWMGCGILMMKQMINFKV